MKIWEQLLNRQPESAMEWGCARISKAIAILEQDHPLPPPSIITVGGTNGKGSTATLIAALLRAHGWKVGLYTSPHMWRFHERIVINDTPIDDATLSVMMQRAEDARLLAQVSLSYFEMATLCAWAYFRAHQVDAVVFEVGLGGRLDAVNAWSADVSALTTIDMDHQAILGNTREQIGMEKIAIARVGKPFFCADPNPPPAIVDTLLKRKVNAQFINRDFKIEQSAHLPHQWNLQLSTHKLSALPLPQLRGAHQLRNAALAIAGVDALLITHRQTLTHQQIRQALTQTKIVARLDYRPRFCDNIDVWFDVAHNPQAAKTLASELPPALPKQRTLAVLGMLNDKDVIATLTPFIDKISAWFFAGLDRINPHRGLSAKDLAKIAQGAFPNIIYDCFDDPSCAFAQALHAKNDGQNWQRLHPNSPARHPLSAQDNDRIIVFGSFHTVSHILPNAH